MLEKVENKKLGVTKKPRRGELSVLERIKGARAKPQGR